MADDDKMIWVRALEGLNVRPNEHRVVARETNDRHPNGEALIFGPDPQEVADTAHIRQRIREGAIEEVSAAEGQKVQERRQQAAAKALGGMGDTNALESRARELATTQSQLSEQQQSLEAERAKLDADRQALAAERQAFEQQKAQKPQRANT